MARFDRVKMHRPHRARPDRWMGRRDVVAVIGAPLVHHVEAYGRNRGADGVLQARWVGSDFEGLALEIRMGRSPLAYIHDASLDGWVDRVYLRPY